MRYFVLEERGDGLDPLQPAGESYSAATQRVAERMRNVVLRYGEPQPRWSILLDLSSMQPAADLTLADLQLALAHDPVLSAIFNLGRQWGLEQAKEGQQ